MVDQPVPVPRSNFRLQKFDLVILKLDDGTRPQINQMVVVFFGTFLVARAAIAEIVALQYPGLFEQADRPIDGGDRDSRIEFCRPLMDRLNIGMVG